MFNRSWKSYQRCSASNFIIEDNAQLFHNTDNVQATKLKTVLPYTERSNEGWNLIASPLANITAINAVVNLLGNNYDLYQYDESTFMWMNQKAADSCFVELQEGKGYLYANGEEVDLSFLGTLRNSSVTVSIPLSYTEGHDMAGWNLVGNPFPCNAYINREYYVMNEDGTGINPVALPASIPIPPCTGVMVKADAEGETLVFTRAVP